MTVRNKKIEELIKDQPVAITLPHGVWIAICESGKPSPELDELQNAVSRAKTQAINDWRDGDGV